MGEIEIRQDGVEQAAADQPLMTVEDVARRLAEIHAVLGDDEVAHSMADDLYRDVLGSIAAGAPNADILASAALRTETLDFARWCA